MGFDSRLLSPIYSLFKGQFKGVEKMVTSRIYIDDICTRGFDELVSNKDQHIKIMVTTHRDRL